METVKLNITRNSAFVAAGMPYRILINGRELLRIANGKTASIDIPKQQSTLTVSMVGNSLNIHKIEKEVTLFPNNAQNGIVNCVISTKANALGVFTSGLFKSMADLEVQVEYL